MVNEATMTRRELKSRLWEIIRTEGIEVTNQNLDWLLERAWKSAQVTDVPSAETREGQIEEMEKISAMDCDEIKGVLGIKTCNDLDCHDCIARLFYAKGYRKASEVAREIFAEIEKNLVSIDDVDFNRFRCIGARTFAELKKKYTEGER